MSRNAGVQGAFDMQWYAWGVVFVGVVIFTIGGMIDMRTNYEEYNRQILEIARRGWGRAGVDLRNPKARPWALAGLAIGGIGVLLMFLLPQ
jgi:hypothetical protein